MNMYERLAISLILLLGSSLFLTAVPLIAGLQQDSSIHIVKFLGTINYSSDGLPWLHTSGQNIYDSSGNQVKLYSVTIQDGDSNHITQTDMQNIKNMGFNAIREFIGYGLVQPNGPTSINTGYFNGSGPSTMGTNLDTFISWAAKAGLYVILCPGWSSTWTPPQWALNLSNGTGLSNGDGGGSVNFLYNSQIQAGVNYLYQWMGQHYASNSNVIFEGFNELATSNDADAGAAFANFNNGWISAIEQGEGSNSHLKIVQMLLDAGSWTYITTSPYVEGTHTNIILATHDYSPMNGWTGSSAQISYVETRYQGLASAVHSAGLPIMDTEWSKDTTQTNWQSFDQTLLGAFTSNNAAGWSYYCYDGSTSAQTGWNLNTPAIASTVLPILQAAMIPP